MTTWDFNASTGAIALALLVLAAAGWLGWQNWTRGGRTKWARALEILRFLLIAMLAFTILRPERVTILQQTELPEVVLLVDQSRSMETRDMGDATNALTRAGWLEAAIARKFWQPLEQGARVVLQRFSPPPANASPTNLVEEGSNLELALEEARERGQNLKAVLLLTDGDWNLGKSPVGAAVKFKQRETPVFSVAIGRETEMPDLSLENVSPPSYGLFGEQIAIPFTARNSNTNEIRAEIRLVDSARQEVKREIVLPPGGQVQDALLWYPRDTGDIDLTLSLPAFPWESQVANNTNTFKIAVRVETLKVLVVDSLPRWEYRYLRNALARDPGVEVNSILFHPGMGPGGGRNYLASFPNSRELISRYDVIFLGDVGIGDGELTPEDATLIRGLVEQQGSGLVFIPGRRGRQASFAQSPLADLMPVVLDPSKPDGHSLENESTISLTTLGKGHLLSRFEADDSLNAQLWQLLPGFYWSAPVERNRPGSEVLGVHSALRNTSGRLPLLVTRSAGSGKVLFMGSDGAWRWRRGVEDKYHYRFWSQVVRWMAHQRHLDTREGIRLSYSPERPSVGDSLYLHATVLNQAGFPAEEGPVAATLRSPSGRSEVVQLSMMPGGWGVFSTTVNAQEPGGLSISIAAPKHGRSLDSRVAIALPQREKIGRPVNQPILSEIAAITGGVAGRAPDLDAIIQKMAQTPEPKPVELRSRLWSHPAWGGALLALLTLYWIGRKIAGLV